MSNASDLFRKFITSLFGTILAVVLLPVTSQFFISLAEEHGFYAHPSDRLRVVIAYVIAVTATKWFGWAAGSLFGLTAGVWIDALFKSKEIKSPKLISFKPVDTADLAIRAADLHSKLLALVGEHEGRIRAAWIEDCRRPERDGSKHADAKGYLLQQYALRFSQDVECVVNLARKAISLNQDDYWVAFGRGSSRTDVAEIAVYMAKLATEFHNPQPDIAMHSPLRAAHNAATINPAGLSAPFLLLPAHATETLPQTASSKLASDRRS